MHDGIDRIETIVSLETASLSGLVVDSEADGWRFVRCLRDEWIDGTNRFQQPGERLFVAQQAGGIIGICGLNIDPYVADNSVGRVRRFYVHRAHRGRGIGRRLVESVIQQAQGRFALLRVRTANANAARLYEKLGFVRTTSVPDCTHLLTIMTAVSPQSDSLHE